MTPRAPHVLLPGFLEPGPRDDLLALLRSRRAQFEAGRLVGGRLDAGIRNGLALLDLDEAAQALRDRALRELPALAPRLGLPAFTPGEVEVQAAAYGDGGHYDRHIDTFVGEHAAAASRVVTIVLYLHVLPKRFSGGALRLFPIGGDHGPVDVEPEHGQAVAFPSFLAHQVMPVSCSGDGPDDLRYAVNIWIRRQAPAGHGRDGKLASVT